MTLVFNSNLQPNAPQTHVFIIGVGRYPYLQGGSDPRNDINLGLKQLSSPVASALAFFRWFLDSPFNNPSAPLGTIEMLLSPDQTITTMPGQNSQVAPATMQEIEQAFGSWYQRCDQHQDNIAIFYFCGHGIEKDNLILLPENFCENILNRWKHAIDFNKTLRGMKQNKAYTQCYFIDSCRQITRELLEDVDVKGEALVNGRITSNVRVALPIFATAPGRSAFGVENQVSFFTKALIQALNGHGAKKIPGGKWAIQTDSLGGTVARLVQKNNLELESKYHQIALPQLGEYPKSMMLHLLSSNPNVEAEITCLPPGVESQHYLFIENANKKYVSPPRRGQWRQIVEAGVYSVGARKAPTANAVIEYPQEMIVPPDYQLTLEI